MNTTISTIPNHVKKEVVREQLKRKMVRLTAQRETFLSDKLYLDTDAAQQFNIIQTDINLLSKVLEMFGGE